MTIIPEFSEPKVTEKPAILAPNDGDDFDEFYVDAIAWEKQRRSEAVFDAVYLNVTHYS